MTFSPQGERGGTLHLPSPTHAHTVDATSAIRQLRQSLSRSPSKGPTFRLITSKSASPSPKSTLSPSPLSLIDRTHSAGSLSHGNISSSAPLAVPFPPSARKARPTTRKISPMRTSSQVRSTQQSPQKRALIVCNDGGNATPPSPTVSSRALESEFCKSVTPEEKENSQSARIVLGSPLPETLHPIHPTRARLEMNNPRGTTVKSSPLKRSDGIMNLDRASLGSPSAKRRSLHGSTFSPSFEIFDHENSFFEGHESRDIEDDFKVGQFNSLENFGSFSLTPKRSSSLRKTTLQQRHEKPVPSKSKPNSDPALEFAAPGQTLLKGRFRMSLENHLPPMVRDSPFNSQGSLLSASVHPLSHQCNETVNCSRQAHQQRHPLSRTITQSSSNSSMAEDSPTHIPVRNPENRRITVDFSKSLPMGSTRPFTRGPVSRETSLKTASTESSFATPENYKLAKPLPAAFMSTGLISKKVKNMGEVQSGLHESTGHMPDTPCKRSMNLQAVVLAPAVDGGVGKARHVRHSFGTPSTPFSSHVVQPAPSSFGKATNIFGSTFANGGPVRRDSFVSVDSEENSQLPADRGDTQSSTESELPPTPTKQGWPEMQKNYSTSLGGHILRRRAASRNFDATAAAAAAPQTDLAGPNCKFPFSKNPSENKDKDGHTILGSSPPASLHINSFSSFSSFPQSRSRQGYKSPVLQSRRFHTSPSLPKKNTIAKRSPSFSASPLSNRTEIRSPHTPHGSILPDPSGLSLSPHGLGKGLQGSQGLIRSTSVFPPATPTAPRESFHQFGKSRSSATPMHGFIHTEVDPVLTAKFDKVEFIGTGEFSQVYRVAQKPEDSSVQGYFSLPIIPHGTSKTPLPDRVWAVKRSRHPYVGGKDRRRKLQEVNILKDLGRADHVVQLVDHWEAKNHLYIQTEFCEEGSLDLFLDNVGRKARLDDFRIWKIMLELSLGLKHVHDHGFIHLDLKPANVLVTFEGVLKIGDFGMATAWPAQSGIDGEGDREYIGPEILMGQFDKPADIFALGLIMLEIAGNVMLPDNGASWQRLRAGDMSDVPSLTWSSEASSIARDSHGKPLSHEQSVDEFYGFDSSDDDFGSSQILQTGNERKSPDYYAMRSGELAEPPIFMTDASNQEALESVVRWMISPQPVDRPTADQIVGTVGCQWTDARRRAGATIYEGNWGPADEILADDAEMIDV